MFFDPPVVSSLSTPPPSLCLRSRHSHYHCLHTPSIYVLPSGRETKLLAHGE
jgi:hypothetical protein